MRTIIITGCNRGIGLEMAKQFHAKGDRVIGVCRKSSTELKQAAEQVIENIDVSSDSCIEKLKASLAGTEIDLLINNAGLLKSTSMGQFKSEDVLKQFEVNAVGPLRVTYALKDFMKEGSKLIFITSRMGSIADNTSGGSYGYRMSKAALNMAGVSLAQDLSHRNITVALIHPGYVRTEMTGGSGNLEPEESAEAIIQRIEALKPEDTGCFRHSNGEVLPW